MISISQPRSSGISRSGLVFTPAIRGCFTTALVYETGIVINCSELAAKFAQKGHERPQSSEDEPDVEPRVGGDREAGALGIVKLLKLELESAALGKVRPDDRLIDHIGARDIPVERICPAGSSLQPAQRR